jgi:tetratricopeptide (TPR) repeat protein
MKSWFIFFYLLSGNWLSAQTYRIDSMKQVLPSLEAKEKIDCLNAIAWQFNFNFIRADSALHYTGLAWKDASDIKYNNGMALSGLISGDVLGRLMGHVDSMEARARKSISLLKSSNNPELLSLAWYKVSIACNSEGKYQAALDAAAMARQVAGRAKDQLALGWAMQAAGVIYCHHGEYWKSFENLIEAQRIGKEMNDSLLVSTSLAFIGRCFNIVGDPNTAMLYYHQAMQYATPFLLLWPHMEDMAYACLQLKQYDSVLYYQQKHRNNLEVYAQEAVVRKKFDAFFWGYSVEVQLARKQFDEVIGSLEPALPQLRGHADVIPLMQSLLILGKAYQAKGNTGIALSYIRELLDTAQQLISPQYIRDANQLLAVLYEQVHKPDSAFAAYKRYTLIKDAMDTTRFVQRTALYLAASGAEQQIASSKKELLKQQQLQRIMMVSLAIVLLLFLLVIRNIILKRKNEKLQSEQSQQALKRKGLELEMQALRAQMNPHFIFNCLSAIDNLIQTSQPDMATTYLARFASLIRGVLDSSKNNLVPFQRDFETLKLYLEMEQFRCNNKFSWSLEANRDLLNGDYKIPPLIIQPFVENAIHHGLLNKPGTNRQLRITAELEGQYIIYAVADNGVGRIKAGTLKQLNKPEHNSYGIAITQERIQLHNRTNASGDVVITDLFEAGLPSGTTAVVRISNIDD